MEMKFAVLIIYYNPNIEIINRLDIYSKCFEKIYIVDNSDVVKLDKSELEKFSVVEYYDMQGNKGISNALNRIFSLESLSDYDFLLTMDQDTDYSLKEIIKMKNFINKNKNKKKEFGIVCPNYAKLYFDKKNNCFLSGKTKIPKTKILEKDRAMTSGSYINVKCIKQIQKVDDLFIELVDDDLSFLIRNLGYKIIQFGESIIYQTVGNPVENTFWNRGLRIIHISDAKYYYLFRNLFYIKKKYLKNKNIKIKKKYMIARYCFNIIFGEKNKIDKFKMCLEGYKDYKKGILGKKYVEQKE